MPVFVNRFILAAFVGVAAVCLVLLVSHGASQISLTMLCVLLLLAAAATLLNLSRSLPVQNIFAATVSIALLADLAQLAGLKAGCFVAPLSYLDAANHKLFNPFFTPFAWVIAILNSRGVAQLILRPWRSTPNYGIWGIGLTCALVFVLDACLDLADWHLDDWQATAACIVSTVVIVILSIPWLINKRPAPLPPPDWQPFIIWQILNLLLTVAEAVHHAPSAAGLHLAAGIVVSLAVSPLVSRRAAPVMN